MGQNRMIEWYQRSQPTGTPPVDCVWTWVDTNTGRIKQMNSAGVVSDYLFQAGNVNDFGQQFFEEFVSSTNTTNNAIVTAYTRTFTGLIVGKKYRVSFNFKQDMNNISSRTNLYLRLDGTNVRSIENRAFLVVNVSETESLLYYFTATNSSHTIDVRFQTINDWAQSTMREKQIEFWRVN